MFSGWDIPRIHRKYLGHFDVRILQVAKSFCGRLWAPLFQDSSIELLMDVSQLDGLMENPSN